MNIETIKFYYINGLWSEARLIKLLEAGKITQLQYYEILAAKEEI